MNLDFICYLRIYHIAKRKKSNRFLNILRIHAKKMNYYYIFSQHVKTNDQMLLLEMMNSSAKIHPNSVNIQMFTFYNNHHE